MRKVKLTEKDLNRIVKKVLEEQRSDRYMFFSNLQQIRRQMDIMLEMDPKIIEGVLENGHDWAQDHIATAKESIDQVFDFFMNKEKEEDVIIPDKDMMEGKNFKMKTPIATLGSIDMKEGKKKSGTKLCARGKASAKAKYDVYPSAYSNGHAVQVCQGKIKGLDGKKRCSSPYC
jgi:hypothetical protein